MNNKRLLELSVLSSKAVLTPSVLTSLLLAPMILSGCGSYPVASQPETPIVVDETGRHSVSRPLGYYSGKTTANNASPTSQPQQPTYQPPYYQPKPPIYQPAQPKSSNYNNFMQWKTDFARRAIEQGHDADAVQRLLSMAQYSPKVVSLDSNQAEFVKMPWQYVEKAVSDANIRTGRSKYATNANLFARIQQQYHVSPYVVSAIWGMESAYGKVTGGNNLASALASLAYDGRRGEFAEKQLLSLLTLLKRGDVSWSHMKGSWAGGMGHTQFIPATWLVQGVDGDYDGRRNPWAMADALSSTANYLHNSGWVDGLSPFVEIRLPSQFDYQQIGMSKTMGQWQNLGIQLISGYMNPQVNAKLWLPAGKDGPALLLTRNFDVIKRYNNSSSYALAVSLLAKQIAYQGGLQQSWPKYEQPLSKYQVKQLQQQLTNLGYDTKGVDGVIGSNTRKAFQRWQMSNGQVADGFICQRSAQSLIR